MARRANQGASAAVVCDYILCRIQLKGFHTFPFVLLGPIAAGTLLSGFQVSQR
jgi:hypothetical protein